MPPPPPDERAPPPNDPDERETPPDDELPNEPDERDVFGVTVDVETVEFGRTTLTLPGLEPVPSRRLPSEL